METTTTKNEVEELIAALESYGFECEGESLKTCVLWSRLKTAVADAAKYHERTALLVNTKITELGNEREKVGRYRGICHKAGTLLETPIHRLGYVAKMLQGTQLACLEVSKELENLRQNLMSV